jgi:hypothetical protein
MKKISYGLLVAAFVVSTTGCCPVGSAECQQPRPPAAGCRKKFEQDPKRFAHDHSKGSGGDG